MSATAAHVYRLARLFTPTYAAHVNAQIVYPAAATVVKPAELVSALARPLHVITYEPHRDATFLAATLAYGLIQGHPFLDGNKRTAFFVANEYLRAQGAPGIPNEEQSDDSYKALIEFGERHVRVARGDLDAEGLYNTSRIF